jgi:hypothetical protein
MVEEMIHIPKSILESAATLNEVEDWLCAHNPQLVEELRRIRQEEDLTGQGTSLEELAEKWHIKL